MIGLNKYSLVHVLKIFLIEILNKRCLLKCVNSI